MGEFYFTMMKRHFILNAELIHENISQMNFISKSDDGWESIYVNPVNNQRWLLTWFNSRSQGGGWPVLKLLPLLSLEELISIAIYSVNEDDIVGAALELNDRETEHSFDFRGPLVDKLERVTVGSLGDQDRNRVRSIITCCSLTDPSNKWEILGKPFLRVREDAKYFSSIAKRAKQLVNILDHSGKPKLGMLKMVEIVISSSKSTLPRARIVVLGLTAILRVQRCIQYGFDVSRGDRFSE